MPYLLPLFSVLLGYAVAIYFRPKKKKNLKLLLAFSGSFLLSLTVMHLLPEVYETSLHSSAAHSEHSSSMSVGLYIMVGILIQILLEFFSMGAEHGHVHGHHKMLHMPWLLFISLCLHAFLEGFPVSHHHHLAIGIAIHHLPIAIILTSFFDQSRLGAVRIAIFMLCFAIMTPLGTFLSSHIPIISDYYTPISAIVIGILFHISSTIIFESSEGHKFNLAKITMIVLGIVMASLL